MNSSANPTDQPFVVDGGVQTPIKSEEDPFRALDDLMAAVEVLCPTWPQWETFRDGGRMLL